VPWWYLQQAKVASKPPEQSPVENLKRGWEAAKEGLRFSINFMRANVGVEDESLLSSPLFLIAIGYLGQHLHYRFSPAEDRDLRRWFYIANARGHYSGSSETTLDTDLVMIKTGGSAPELLEALRREIGRFEIEPGDMAGRGQRSALFSTAYLALKARGAKDWRTRLRLSLTHSGRFHFIEYHHIFPKAGLRGRYEKSEINEIANMAFVSGATNRRMGGVPAERTLTELKEEQGEQVLVDHCIPLDPQLWKVENYCSFLEYRRAALASAINEFIGGEMDRAISIDIDGLLDAGEGELVEFKSSARWDYREEKLNKALEQTIIKTIASFLNRRGGTLLIGVDDDARIVGLEADYATLGKKQNRDGYQQFLVQLVSGSLGKNVCANLAIAFVPLQGKDICVVRASASPSAVYLEDQGQSKLFVRLGNTSQELTGKQAVEYAKSHWPGG
jgi:hypothetical protein